MDNKEEIKKYILYEYNLNEVDILKVEHHGSITIYNLFKKILNNFNDSDMYLTSINII